MPSLIINNIILRLPLILLGKKLIGSFLVLISIKFFGLFLKLCKRALLQLNAILFTFGLLRAICSDIQPPKLWPVTKILPLSYLFLTLFKCAWSF